MWRSNLAAPERGNGSLPLLVALDLTRHLAFRRLDIVGPIRRALAEAIETRSERPK